VSRGFAENVVCRNTGLGSVPGERVLYIFDPGAGTNSLYRREGIASMDSSCGPVATETVLVDTLDHYCEVNDLQAIDYLKLDVEGHELEVCKGASRLLEEGRIAMLQFEYGGCNIDARVLLKDLFGFLQQFGYAMFKLYPTRLQLMRNYDQRFENFQYQNWVAAKPSFPALECLVEDR
jgi:FkbM family methyltransferase